MKNKLFLAITIMSLAGTAIGQSAPEDRRKSEVKKYLSLLQTLGEVNNVVITSSWHRKEADGILSKGSSKKAINEVKEQLAEYLQSSETKSLGNIMSFEDQQVCEQWKPYAKEEFKNKESHYSSEKSFQIDASLKSVAGAFAGAFTRTASSSVLWGLFKGSGAQMGIYNNSFNLTKGDFGISTSSSVKKDSIETYLVKRELYCTKIQTYSRAKIILTPDILSYRSEIFATKVAQFINEKLDGSKQNLDLLLSVLDQVAAKPVYSIDEFLANFKDFEVVNLYHSGYFQSKDELMNFFVKEFRTRLEEVHLILKALNKSEYKDLFAAGYSELQLAKMKNLIEYMAAFETSKIEIAMLPEVKRFTLINSHFLKPYLVDYTISADSKNESIANSSKIASMATDSFKEKMKLSKFVRSAMEQKYQESSRKWRLTVNCFYGTSSEQPFVVLNEDTANIMFILVRDSRQILDYDYSWRNVSPRICQEYTRQNYNELSDKLN